MNKKETYLHPSQTVISLEMMRETLQGGSSGASVSGADLNVTNMTGDEFTTIFGL